MALKGGDKKREAGNNPVTIRGIVIPIDWDEKGNVVAVAVSTYDEVDYLIENSGKEEELKEFIREEVEVSGVLKEEKSRLTIQIQEFRPTPGFMSAGNSIDQSLKKK